MGVKIFKNWPRLLVLLVGLFLFYALDKFATAQNFNEDLNISITATVPSNTTPPPSGGGGGGAGGPTGPINPPVQNGATVMFTGRAYPNTTVTLLKDGALAATTIIGSDAIFNMSLTGLSQGSFVFSLYSQDKDGQKSLSLTYPISVTTGVITQISGIFIAPTISVDKASVKRGDNLAIFGQTVPASEVTIAVHSLVEIFQKVVADNSGVYLHNLDTSVLEEGSHITKSKSAISGQVSEYGKSVSFSVGDTTLLNPDTDENAAKSDINGDNKVNLVDFSIMAYWYKRSAPPADYDLNVDGRIDLIDFSIMAYYWTG